MSRPPASYSVEGSGRCWHKVAGRSGGGCARGRHVTSPFTCTRMLICMHMRVAGISVDQTTVVGLATSTILQDSRSKRPHLRPWFSSLGDEHNLPANVKKVA